ncbi:TetR family transcriptional regulator [Actinocorallia herbida]|uniref:TetR family transcriptional regulator n=1 Tax=Actinocorallia herbida TaxID=58109 RepID=A0A3N1D6C8_9ACTN|nr:TetR/AcrR family transcriptional regulator [Actinocorallia herbida]ROO89085.1 TetR family transcriptional regulator [Actinocorallia herbida]
MDSGSGHEGRDGFLPPRQERSREVLRRVLASAEHVLGERGLADFTMAAVAADAGVSVGAIYRRFEGREPLLAAVKDLLLTRLEEGVAGRLRDARPDLAGVVDAFVRGYAESFAAGRRVFPDLLGGAPGTALAERGDEALRTTRALFRAAADPHVGEVVRADPETALTLAWQTITSAFIHRATMPDGIRDDLPWDVYAVHLRDMTLAYLTSPGGPPPAA